MAKKVIKEDIQRAAYQLMIDRLNANKIQYNEQELKSMTYKLFENLDRGIGKIVNEAFDTSILKGIDHLTPSEVPKLIKSLVGDIYQRKSPFAPIQAIALYFSEKGALGHSVGAKPIINHLLKDADVSKAVWIIQQTIKKIESLIEQRGMGYQMIYEFEYLLDDVINAVTTLNVALNKNYQLDWFRGSEAIDGSKDGKRKGLASILIQASMNMSKLKEFIGELKKFADKGKDVMKYRNR